MSNISIAIRYLSSLYRIHHKDGTKMGGRLVGRGGSLIAYTIFVDTDRLGGRGLTKSFHDFPTYIFVIS